MLRDYMLTSHREMLPALPPPPPRSAFSLLLTAVQCDEWNRREGERMLGDGNQIYFGKISWINSFGGGRPLGLERPVTPLQR